MGTCNQNGKRGDEVINEEQFTLDARAVKLFFQIEIVEISVDSVVEWTHLFGIFDPLDLFSVR